MRGGERMGAGGRGETGEGEEVERREETGEKGETGGSVERREGEMGGQGNDSVVAVNYLAACKIQRQTGFWGMGVKVEGSAEALNTALRQRQGKMGTEL